MNLTDDGKRELWLGLHPIGKHWMDILGKSTFDTGMQMFETGKLIMEGWATNYYGEHGAEMPVAAPLQTFLKDLRLALHPDVQHQAKGPWPAEEAKVILGAALDDWTGIDGLIDANIKELATPDTARAETGQGDLKYKEHLKGHTFKRSNVWYYFKLLAEKKRLPWTRAEV